MRQRYALFLDVLEREASPQLIHNLLVRRALVGQFARQRSLAEAHCLGDVGSLRLAVRKELLHLVLNQGSQRSDRRVAFFRSLIANGLERLKQVSIFGDEREGQRLMREYKLIACCAKLDRATEEPLERPQVGVASVDET